MIRLFGQTIPNQIYVACSGGVDSMAALSFLSNKSYRNITVAFFHHGTEDSERAQLFLQNYLNTSPFKNVASEMVIGNLKAPKPPRKSPEEHWRDERYSFLHTLDAPVITAHHLDDCIETWLFGAINGKPKTIPFRNKNVMRPFLTTPKEKLQYWCERKAVPWIEDSSNKNVSYARNRIRHNIMPEVLKVNPGIAKVVVRKIYEAYDNQEDVEIER